MSIELEPQVLRARVNSLMEGINEGAGHALDIGSLRELDRLTHERHEDLLMVHLGMKPMATFFEPVIDIRRRFGESYISKLAKPEMRMSTSGDAIWNPEFVEEVLVDNNDLLNRSLDYYPDLSSRLVSPQSSDFIRFVRMASNMHDLKEAIALEGVMHGYPREACEILGEYHPLISRLVGIVRDTLEERRQDSILNSNFSPYQLALNEGGLKDELLRVADSLPRKINPKVINNIQQMRLADVPGSRYFTFRDITVNHERRVKEAFFQSGIRQKLGIV